MLGSNLDQQPVIMRQKPTLGGGGDGQLSPSQFRANQVLKSIQACLTWSGIEGTSQGSSPTVSDTGSRRNSLDSLDEAMFTAAPERPVSPWERAATYDDIQRVFAEVCTVYRPDSHVILKPTDDPDLRAPTVIKSGNLAKAINDGKVDVGNTLEMYHALLEQDPCDHGILLQAVSFTQTIRNLPGISPHSKENLDILRSVSGLAINKTTAVLIESQSYHRFWTLHNVDALPIGLMVGVHQLRSLTGKSKALKMLIRTSMDLLKSAQRKIESQYSGPLVVSNTTYRSEQKLSLTPQHRAFLKSVGGKFSDSIAAHSTTPEVTLKASEDLMQRCRSASPDFEEVMSQLCKDSDITRESLPSTREQLEFTDQEKSYLAIVFISTHLNASELQRASRTVPLSFFQTLLNKMAARELMRLPLGGTSDDSLQIASTRILGAMVVNSEREWVVDSKAPRLNLSALTIGIAASLSLADEAKQAAKQKAVEVSAPVVVEAAAPPNAIFKEAIKAVLNRTPSVTLRPISETDETDMYTELQQPSKNMASIVQNVMAMDRKEFKLRSVRQEIKELLVKNATIFSIASTLVFPVTKVKRVIKGREKFQSFAKELATFLEATDPATLNPAAFFDEFGAVLLKTMKAWEQLALQDREVLANDPGMNQAYMKGAKATQFFLSQAAVQCVAYLKLLFIEVFKIQPDPSAQELISQSQAMLAKNLPSKKEVYAPRQPKEDEAHSKQSSTRGSLMYQ